ncbi:MAG: hypothetical protein KatS3mg068_0674 [Candidatus Sericytochromatia bacterium]|nr:MAG: hypothetical protein KatS3mg068_0674 [Candidatus Sericytochromatia bacterium]
MLKLNKVNILSFDLWDADTGEADVTFKFNNTKLKAFSLDDFSNDKEAEVILSIFPKEIEIIDNNFENKCENISNNFQIKLIGDIVDIKSDEEQGDFLIINSQDILFSVFIPNNKKEFKIGGKVKILGRLDIEKPVL